MPHNSDKTQISKKIVSRRPSTMALRLPPKAQQRHSIEWMMLQCDEP